MSSVQKKPQKNGWDSCPAGRRGDGRARGGITLFLSLMLTVLIAFLCTALQSARWAGSRYLFTLASEASVKSMFAAYDTRMWEQYRILLLSDTELAEQIGAECAQSYSHNGTLCPITVSSVEFTDRETVTENGAAGWEEAAVSYMEVRLPAETVSWLWEQSGLAESLEDMTKWLTGFRDLFEPIVSLEQKLCDLEQQLSEAVEAFRQGKELMETLGNCARAMKQLTADAAGVEEQKAAWQTLRDCLTQVQEYARSEEDRLLSLADQVTGRMQEIQALRQQVTELISELDRDFAVPGVTVLSDLGEYLSGLTERFDFLQSLPEGLKEQYSRLAQLSGITLPSWEELDTEDGQELVSRLQQLAAELAGGEWAPDQPDRTEGSEEEAAALDRIWDLKNWLNQGILWLVLKDSSSVSGAVLSHEIDRTERTETAGMPDQAYRNLLYGEYALRYTAAYGEQGGAGLQYETEYLIAGGQCDRDNLALVASRLLLLRGAANLGYLLSDEASRSQAQTVAAGISSALGGWIPVSVMAVLLMVLWALAEAVCDVRGLLDEGKIPFWKDSGSWQLSWSGIWSLLDGEFLTGTDREDGMRYEDYLRLFLFLTPLEEKCFRTMETAEENMAAARESFQLEQAVVRAAVTVKGQAAGQDCRITLSYGYCP